jgi:serine/threonine protein phosphatase PrpC
MSPFETVSATQAYRERCEDRVAVFNHDSRTVVVVADGAGGTGAGDVAAFAVIREIEAVYLNIHSANEWASFLRQIDCRIGDGETTAVVVDVRTIGIAGASVGDSRAVIVKDGTISELTANQKRKPLIGTGMAEPIGFVCPPLDGLLLLGTDGFFNYAKPNAIIASIAKSDFQTLPSKCIDMVRLPSGEYWDDVGIVAVRNRPRSSTRRRFNVD